MAHRKDLPSGVHCVKSDKVKVIDKKTKRTHEYSCMLFSHNYLKASYYTVRYETGWSFNGGLGKEYKQYKTKAAAQKGLTAMKKKLRKQGHPFSG